MKKFVHFTTHYDNQKIGIDLSTISCYQEKEGKTLIYVSYNPLTYHEVTESYDEVKEKILKAI